MGVNEFNIYFMKIFIRNATKKDVKNIFEWRNDSDSIAMSLSSKVISWDEHLKWYRSALKDDNIMITICEFENRQNQEIGMVRFDFDPLKNSASISINLNPIARGKSIGQYCLRAAINFMQKKNKNFKKIVADIKKENIASIKSFEKAGFYSSKINFENKVQYIYDLNDE